MSSKTLKLMTLFFVAGGICGLLTILLSYLLPWVMWIGAGLFLLLGLVVSVSISEGNRWVTVKATWWRRLIGALIVVAAYPISVLVMLGGFAFYESLFSKFFPEEWRERVLSGSYPHSIWPLYIAGIVGAVLVSTALRIFTKKWDKRAMLLMIVAGVVTIPLSEGIGLVMGERNWHLILFPVGEAFFSALCGYWLMRVRPVQEQVVSSPATAREPHQRPA